MFKILSIETEEESEYKGTGNTSDLTTLEAMAFGYDVQWPISLILNRRSLAMYQMLFRHLFYCKHVEKLLSFGTNLVKSHSAIAAFSASSTIHHHNGASACGSQPMKQNWPVRTMRIKTIMDCGSSQEYHGL